MAQIHCLSSVGIQFLNQLLDHRVDFGLEVDHRIHGISACHQLSLVGVDSFVTLSGQIEWSIALDDTVASGLVESVPYLFVILSVSSSRKSIHALAKHTVDSPECVLIPNTPVIFKKN